MQFVKVNLNDIVVDTESKSKGKVVFLDTKNKTAKIDVIISQDKETGIRTSKLIVAKLYNLVVINKAKQPARQMKFDFDRQYTLVKRFHETFGHLVSTTPKPIPLKRAIDRAVWTAEEIVAEFLHVSSSNNEEYLVAIDQFLERFTKTVQENLAKPYPTDEIDRIVGQTDSLGDGLYLTNGSFVELGIKPSRPFEIIQASNMSKLDDDGKPIYKEDGKIAKSHNFFPPEPKLREEIERQIKESSPTD